MSPVCVCARARIADPGVRDCEWKGRLCRLAPATSAPGLGSPPGTSVPGSGSPLPHLRWDWAHLWHIVSGWATPCHICTGTGVARPTRDAEMMRCARARRCSSERGRPSSFGPRRWAHLVSYRLSDTRCIGCHQSDVCMCKRGHEYILTNTHTRAHTRTHTNTRAHTSLRARAHAHTRARARTHAHARAFAGLAPRQPAAGRDACA